MYMTVSIDEFADSQEAIREYIAYDPRNEYPHDARVIVKRNGNTIYDGIIQAWAKIEHEYSHANIEWERKEELLFHMSYNNCHQLFHCYGGTLIITKTTDKAGNKIEISIS